MAWEEVPSRVVDRREHHNLAGVTVGRGEHAAEVGVTPPPWCRRLGRDLDKWLLLVGLAVQLLTAPPE